MTRAHIVRAYSAELQHLATLISEMGTGAATQLEGALRAVAERDSDLAADVVRGDARLDELERSVETEAVRLLALRQPVAVDLRTIVAALKTGAELERIADYAANIAKRAIILGQTPEVRPIAATLRMGKMALETLRDVVDAYANWDVDKALSVWNRDEELDEMYTSLFREVLTYMFEDPRTITPSTHLIFIAKNLERIGDHATNVAETIYFQVKGQPLQIARTKGDRTNAVAVPPLPGTEEEAGQTG